MYDAFRPFNFIKDGMIVDYASGTVTYYGFYNPSTVLTTGGAVDTSKAQFLIQKVTVNGSSQITSAKWAIGTDASSKHAPTYDQIWDNRASLTYI